MAAGAHTEWATTPGTWRERTVQTPLTGGRRGVAIVRYAYVVDGRAYEGNRLYVVAPTRGRVDLLQAQLAALPDPPLVRHDPRDPAQCALLDVPASWIAWSLAAAGVALMTSLIVLVSAFA